MAGIDPDARRRRLTALINSVSMARTEPAVYVIEDAHWIDDVSESMLAEFLVAAQQRPPERHPPIADQQVSHRVRGDHTVHWPTGGLHLGRAVRDSNDVPRTVATQPDLVCVTGAPRRASGRTTSGAIFGHTVPMMSFACSAEIGHGRPVPVAMS
jgi:hypothetical protein